MNNKKANIIIITLTALSALAAVSLVHVYINNRVTTARQKLDAKYNSITRQADLVDVVVCAVDIPAGSKISADDIKIQKFSKESIDQDHIISDPAAVIGQKIQQNMYEGEWIVKERLHHVNPKVNNKITLAAGHRAIRLWLDATSGLLGIIAPKDKVDVLAVLPGSNKGRQKIGKIILQDIQVLSVGNRLRSHNEADNKQKDNKYFSSSSQIPKATTITLEVTPQQALQLTLAMEIGKIHLALRNADDQEIVISSPGLTLSSLSVSGKKASPRRHSFRKMKKIKKETVTIISGDRVNTEVIKK